jgi:uncharacterized protein
MAGGRPVLVVNAVELLRVPGTRKHVSVVIAPVDVDAASEAIAGDLTVEVDLESTVDDVGLSGTIGVPWAGHCRRCLRTLAETLVIDVDERYADSSGPLGPAAIDAAFPIERGEIDLRPMVREEVLLAVGEARLCRPDCPGLCPVCGKDVSVEPCDCDTTVVDDRWSVLDQLRES